MPSKLTLIAVAVALVIGTAGGWKLRDYQASEDALDSANAALEQVKTDLLAADAISAADAEKSKTLEELLAAIRIEPKVIIKRETMYVENPIYRGCIVPVDGVRLLNDRIAARRRS